MGGTVQTTLYGSLNANIASVALSSVIGLASGNGGDSIAQCSIGKLYYIGSNVFEQLRFILRKCDNEIYNQAFSTERDNFIISKHTLRQQSVPVRIYLQNFGFKLKLLGIKIDQKAKG